jgi:hypothetical protein
MPLTSQAVAIALPIACATCVALLHLHQKRRGKGAEAAPISARSPHPANGTQADTAAVAESAELMAEQLSRNTQFLGPEGQERVASSVVVVVGVGGVGSHCASLLARTGVRRLRLIDCGRVTRRSLGSHALAAASDVGELKVEVMRRGLLRVVPQAEIDAVPTCLEASNAAAILDGADFVVLCIPPAPASASPAATCHLAAAFAACAAVPVRTIAVLYDEVAASAAARSVAHQRLSSLHDINCSVAARALTARLRNLVDPSGATPMPCHSTQDTLLCVHAGEHVTPHLRLSSSSADALRTVTPRVGAGGSSEAGEGGGGVARPCAHHFDDRCAVLAGMGDAAASACIMQLAGSPPTPTSGIFSRANREDAYKALVRRERETFGSDPFDGGGGFDVWPEDCEYLVMEAWGGRCVLSGECMGGGGPSLVLTRWKRHEPTTVGNLILLAKPLAEAHDKADDPHADWASHLVSVVEATLARASQERAAWACSRPPASSA